MKKIFFILAAILLMGCDSEVTDSGTTPNVTIQPNSLDSDVVMEEVDANLVESIWKFTDLTQELINTEENEVYSPLSLYMALSMLLPATSEATHQELLEGLSISSRKEYEDMVQPLLEKNNILDDEEDYASLLTNSIWLQNDRDDYDEAILEELLIQYQAMHNFVDFKNTEATKESIEEFIDEQTNGFIKDLDLNLEPETVVLLLNTLYFKDQWLEQFYEGETLEFTNKNGESFEIGAVTGTLKSPRYFKDDVLEMVIAPFENGNQMLFIKPEDIEEFFGENKLDLVHSIIEDLDYAKSTNVYLTMPEVDISSSFDELNHFLSPLGFEELMSDNPQLSYIEGEDTGMAISDIIQQARIAVDREGVEAAAYTAIAIEETSAPIIDTEIEMDLDQPYIMVVLSPEDIPMFISAVNDPSDTE